MVGFTKLDQTGLVTSGGDSNPSFFFNGINGSVHGTTTAVKARKEIRAENTLPMNSIAHRSSLLYFRQKKVQQKAGED